MTSDRAAADTPFEPQGIVWERVSARLIPARLLLVLPFFVLPAIGLGVVAALTASWVWIPTVVWALLGVWVAILIPRQVRAIGYAEREDDLLIRKGVMFRTLVVVPYGRMQYVDVQAGPVARSFKIATVQLHTAAPGTDASISGLLPSEAARLRDRLASRGEAKLAGL